MCYNSTKDRVYTIDGKECKANLSKVAEGRYANQVNTTGFVLIDNSLYVPSRWGILEIETFPGHEYELQAYAAGVAEGQALQLKLRRKMFRRADAPADSLPLPEHRAEPLQGLPKLLQEALQVRLKSEKGHCSAT